MTTKTPAEQTKAGFKILFIAMVGCVIGSYGINHLVFAGEDSDRDAAARITMTQQLEIQDDLITQGEETITRLEGDVVRLEALNDALVDDNHMLLAKIDDMTAQNTELLGRIAGMETVTPAAVGEAEELDETVTILPAEATDTTDTASSYLAVLAVRYDDLEGRAISDYDLSSIESIGASLDEIDREVLMFAEGMKYNFSDAQRELYEQYRVALLSHQSDVLPSFRDAFGPAMRLRLEGSGYSAKTTEKGYRTAAFKSDEFYSTSTIQNFHADVHELMVRLRFKEAVYMDADGVQIFGTVEFTPVPDDSLLLNDKIN